MKHFIVFALLLATIPSYSNVQNPQTWGERWAHIQKTFIEYDEKIDYEPFISPLVRRDDPGLEISVNIANLDTLVLVATIGYDDYHRDHAVWGQATLVTRTGAKKRLCDLTPIYTSTGWGPVLYNKNYTGKQLQIGSKKLKHGVIAHAHSELVYVINSKYNRFEALVGIDQEADPIGDVRFKVLSHSEKKLLEPLEKVEFSQMSNISVLTEVEKYMWLYNNNSVEEQNELISTRIEKLGENGIFFKRQFEKLSEQETPSYDIQRFELYKNACQLKHVIAELSSINLAPLKDAINDLVEYFQEKYTNSPKYIKQVEKLEYQKSILSNSLSQFDENKQKDLLTFIQDFKHLQFEALTNNPLLKAHPILYIVRHQYKPDHHNTATIFQTGEVNTASYEGGGALKMIDFAQNGKITTLIQDEKAVYRDPEVHYNGDKIVFSMRKNIQDNYHIYQINSDGSGFKQLTGAPGVADIDPNYLPNDDIVFSSTREPKYCMCNIHIMANLFRMDPDGANIFQIGKSTLFEGHSSIMPDGRILYDRWEYIDRNFGDAQGLWTVNPDGTNHAVYWGNNTNSPGGVIDARYIPGTERVIAILGSCHDRPWGALGIIDRRLGFDLKEPIIRTWPSNAIDLVGVGDFDTFKKVLPRYEDPFPLSEKYFLCSREIKDEQMGIFLIDVFGNETLLHTEGPGCYDPMPVAPRYRPPVIPDKNNFAAQTGKFYIQDVYIGTHMEGVKRGAVKTLRVIESPEKRFWTEPAWNGQGVHRPGLNWHSFENKKILGEVPVEEDGSAYFEVPANRYIYFQLLDENGMMVQSMRSGTIIQPGEVQGCIGCHDNRQSVPPQIQVIPIATKRAPSQMNGWYGEPRNFNFVDEVQPVFDKHCVGCHDFGKPAGEKVILAGDRNLFFNASYIELWQKKLINSIGAGPSEIQPAYSWGSHTSKLVKTVQAGHHDVKLDQEEWDRINTWIDINGVYYPEYSSAFPGNLAGRSPLTNEQVNRLGELTGVNFVSLAGHTRNLVPQISFDRPGKSPCLENIPNKNGKKYKEALSIIQKGKEILAATPRADMKYFRPNIVDQQRQTKYNSRQQIEQQNKKAITLGKKCYDPEIKNNE